jgi:hypothetical protein
MHTATRETTEISQTSVLGCTNDRNCTCRATPRALDIHGEGQRNWASTPSRSSPMN